MSPDEADAPAAPRIEWWRVCDICSDLGRRMLFVDAALAEGFARHLVGATPDPVVLEHWCDGELLDVHLVVRPN